MPFFVFVTSNLWRNRQDQGNATMKRQHPCKFLPRYLSEYEIGLYHGSQ
ncbi:hypothetical protein Dd703_0595 [Musicola paradisiaca Ech703]|uniref:Uncharacterized protein n=1 Tax=Musicola paradisiaca (strain Ech703) TaxID=579405 RepID=C6C9F5_MUSP7|nr:hypothetical protein Dd703_0595 [Musicola paradisiaca Ech703]